MRNHLDFEPKLFAKRIRHLMSSSRLLDAGYSISNFDRAVLGRDRSRRRRDPYCLQ